MRVLLLLAILAHHAAAAPSCEQTIARWKKLVPSDDDVKRNQEQAKVLLAACRQFQWSAPYRQCLAAGKKYESRQRCFQEEYERGDNRERCEAILDDYMKLAEIDFADLAKDHDKAWFDDLLTSHRDTMRPWCVERAMMREPQVTCAHGAKTRDEFLQCGEPVIRPSGRAAAPRSPSRSRDRSR